jgi:hypothetical protein
MDEKIAENLVLLQVNGRRSRPSLTQELSKPEHDVGPAVVYKSWDNRAKSSATIAVKTSPYKCELRAMAMIWAYYDIASARFVDQVIQAVEAELFPTLCDNLGPELMDVLKQ